MVYLLLITQILGFIAVILVIRHFFKQLANKMAKPELQQPLPPQNPLPAPNFLKDVANPVFVDAPAANSVLQEDPNEVDYDENIPMTVPPTVKLDVEGGDSQVPPGFEENTDKTKP